MYRKVAEHSAVHDIHLLLVRQSHRNRLEEKGDRHAHSDGACDVEVVGVDAEVPDVLRKDEQRAPREVTPDDTKLLAIALRVFELVHDQIPEFSLALLVELRAHPLLEVRALVDA